MMFKRSLLFVALSLTLTASACASNIGIQGPSVSTSGNIPVWSNNTGDQMGNTSVPLSSLATTANTLLKANNLSDVANPATALSNLGGASTSMVLLKANNLSDVVTPATALSNLGGATSGANANITSLTGLTTPLSQHQGGTGTATAGIGAVNNITGQSYAGFTGTGNLVGSSSPTFVTPVLGGASATSLTTSGLITANGGILDTGLAGTGLRAVCTDASGNLTLGACGGGGGSGNITGPSSSVVGNILTFGNTTGTSALDSGTALSSLAASNATTTLGSATLTLGGTTTALPGLTSLGTGTLATSGLYTASGGILDTSLAGTGDRAVCADGSGNLLIASCGGGGGGGGVPLSPGNFYVSATGSDSADCLAATVVGADGPCLTIQHAVSVALGYDANSANVTVNIGAGTFATPNVSGGLRGFANATTPNSTAVAPYLILSGAGSASTSLTNIGTGSPLTLAAITDGAHVEFTGLTLDIPSTGAIAALVAIKASGPGTIVRIGSDITAFATVSNGLTHVFDIENQAIVEDVGNTITLTGVYVSIATLTNEASLILGSGSNIACSGTTAPTIHQFAFVMAAGSTVTAVAPSFTACTPGANNAPYKVSGNSILDLAPQNIPVGSGGASITLGNLITGGVLTDAVPPTTTTQSGLGSSCTAATCTSVSSGASSRGGIITLSPTGSGIAATGSVILAWGDLLLPATGVLLVPCTYTLINTATPWNARATVISSTSGSATGIFTWDNNGVALVAGDTYAIGYTCNG